MSDLLDGCRAKIAWAKRERNTLKRQIERFLKANPYPISREIDPQRPEYLFKISIARMLPKIRWGLMVGDCVHNARSALDHLVWSLSEWYSGPDPTDDATMFVVAETHDRFEATAKFRLRRLQLFIHTYLEETQPYTGQNLGHNDPLWLVQYFDNRDKHKVISVATSILQGQVISGRGLLPAQPVMRTGRFEDGATVARVPFVPPADMGMNLYPTFEIVFDESPLPVTPYLNVVHTLNRIVHRIERIADRFDEVLSRHYGLPLPKKK